jgi:hypothetical protein
MQKNVHFGQRIDAKMTRSNFSLLWSCLLQALADSTNARDYRSP